MIHVVSDVGFGMIFFSFLHINRHHITGNEKGSKYTWFWGDEDDGGAVLYLHRVLCFCSVCFFFSPYCSLWYFKSLLLSSVLLKLYPFVFFCSLSSLPSPFLLFFFFSSLFGFFLLAFIAGGNGVAWFLLIQPLNFLQLCNQIPAKILIGSLNVSPFLVWSLVLDYFN